MPDRDCADAIFYVLKTGCQWQAPDQPELCAHLTAHDRFQQWVQAGLERFAELGGTTGTGSRWMGRWPKRHWAGKKTGPNPTDRGKSGVKRSILTKSHGAPIGLAIEGANRHDRKLVRLTIEAIAVGRPAPRAEQPQGMCLDKGYKYDEVRATLDECASPPIFAHAEKKPGPSKPKPTATARRWVVERAHSWMNVRWLNRKTTAPTWQQTMPPAGGPYALEILRQRYARGEIDATTFEQMRERLEAPGPYEHQPTAPH